MYPGDQNQPQQPYQPQPQPGGQPPVPQQPEYTSQPQQSFQQPGQPQQPYQPQPQFQPLAPTENPLPPISGAVPTTGSLPPKKLNGPFALVFNDWMKAHWKRVILIIFGVIILGLMIFQIVYPNSRMLPEATVDGVAVGGLRKDEAAKELNEAYGDVQLKIFFGKNDAAFLEPKIKDVGISVVNDERIDQMQYPFYLRIIPTSIFWANGLIKPSNLEYAYDKQKIQTYTQSKVGDSCTIPAQDATLKLIDSQLQVVPSVPGGECDITQFQQILAETQPKGGENNVRIDSTDVPAKVDDDKARQLADMLNTRLKEPMPLSLGAESESVPGRVVLSWLDFKSDVPEDSIDTANQTAKLVYEINKERIGDYMNAGIASKVVKKPGVSKVSTLDFKETSRVNGPGGRELDFEKVIGSVTDYINSRSTQAVAVTREVGPTTVYTRSYTPTSVGLSALLAQFAQDNPGTYGLAVQELSNVKYPRSASFNGDVRFKSAGIESLYLGYAAIKDRYTGQLRPAEKIADDRDVTTCLKDMYEKFDEDCRLGFYNRFGHKHITERGSELGLTGTVFAATEGVTSANDLNKTIVGIHTGKIARSEGSAELLSMSRNIRENEGIPAGISSGSAGHFVGENEIMHNDAAIVSTSRGVYSLVVLSQDSSWEKIAALSKKIEDFKKVKIPASAR